MRVKVTVVVVLVVLALAGGLVSCLVFGPDLLVGPVAGLTPAEQLKARNDGRSTLLQGFAGLLALSGVALGAMMTLRQVRANREGHTIDLFTKAIDQLASDKVSVRHGGVYALELLADLDPGYQGHAHALLTAFVRQQLPWPPLGPEPDRSRFHGGLPDDIGAVLAVLKRGSVIGEGASSELERVDLRGADLDGLDIPRVCFAYSNLDGASLVGAKLGGATLLDVTLRGADLRSADLTGANLEGADLSGVITDEATVWPHGFTPPG
ncbi:Uncharacterized protein YjbI, contains pentapeptide repeats [Amycolatopsis xylanica]|uniref:Uncharacterized protein YjbI, contains pentapeptide repeats n=1 Tax=Amycolatopsis xylanica TaxID=589385 RepID=A0A1H3GSP5_9PSEU|nr:pentapeptide repeat-containing protein [Amycolatopsis xylanica]SDY06070.1 Uncharacterized protein YjbI, contains pentapeptide repeats [Amycolatopsis xylanica]